MQAPYPLGPQLDAQMALTCLGEAAPQGEGAVQFSLERESEQQLRWLA